jgi:hypothetical protein
MVKGIQDSQTDSCYQSVKIVPTDTGRFYSDVSSQRYSTDHDGHRDQADADKHSILAMLVDLRGSIVDPHARSYQHWRRS